jgi:hypothetical protein
VGESYDDDDVQADGDRLRGDGDQGCDCHRGRGSPRGDRHFSPGWAYGHEASVRGHCYRDADADGHKYRCFHWDSDTGPTTAHGYDRPGVGSMYLGASGTDP